MIRRPPRSTQSRSSAASDVYKRQAKMSQELKKELSKAPAKTWMQKYMDDNVGLIKSIPIDAAKRVHKLIKENQYVGLRSTDLIDEIMRIGSISCLLYTSDAADDLLCVDLGGRRSIKKKKKQYQHQSVK